MGQESNERVALVPLVANARTAHLLPRSNALRRLVTAAPKPWAARRILIVSSLVLICGGEHMGNINLVFRHMKTTDKHKHDCF